MIQDAVSILKKKSSRHFLCLVGFASEVFFVYINIFADIWAAL